MFTNVSDYGYCEVDRFGWGYVSRVGVDSGSMDSWLCLLVCLCQWIFSLGMFRCGYVAFSYRWGWMWSRNFVNLLPVRIV